MGDCVANLYNVPTACENITEQYKQIYRKQSDVIGDQDFISDGQSNNNDKMKVDDYFHMTKTLKSP